MQKIPKFFEEIGLSSDLFLRDFYFFFPEIEKGDDLHYEECLAFLDYILTPKITDKQITDAFKLLDKFCNGHIKTNELLGLLRKQMTAWEYERYSNIISAYGPAVNYIELFTKKK